MRSRTTEWISSGMRQAPFSLVDRGWSRRVNAWASLFMNNSCPVLVKRMMPVAPCCLRLCACFCPVNGRATFSVAMIGMYPPILSRCCYYCTYCFVESNRVVQLPLLRLCPVVKQVVGLSAAALTMDWQKTLNDRTGWMFGRFVEQFFSIAGGPIDILSESKVIPAESNLILLRRYAGLRVLGSEF